MVNEILERVDNKFGNMKMQYHHPMNLYIIQY
jgi:hypothetical protein